MVDKEVRISQEYHALYGTSPTINIEPVPSVLQIGREIYLWGQFDCNQQPGESKVEAGREIIGEYDLSESKVCVTQRLVQECEGSISMIGSFQYDFMSQPRERIESSHSIHALKYWIAWKYGFLPEPHRIPEHLPIPSTCGELIEYISSTELKTDIG